MAIRRVGIDGIFRLHRVGEYPLANGIRFSPPQDVHHAVRQNDGTHTLIGLCPVSYTHLDVYKRQEYAVAFSKSWGEGKHLQPVHYLNKDSQYAKDFSALSVLIL